MGLDAVVFCDCYEKGRLKRPPPHPGLVYVAPNGDLGCRTNDPKLLDQFDAWRTHARRHECVATVVVGRPAAWAGESSDPWARLECPLVAASDHPDLPEEK